MAKLGYTWYPKDWGNSESVFELNLSERGLYRELIDLAMMNDNKTEIKLDVWSRKFAIDVDGLKIILGKLSILNLIQINGEKLFIPSCESRLNLVRGGSKGGKNKPNIKPIVNPIVSLEEKNEKPISNQIEIETKKENEIETKNKIEIPTFDEFLIYGKEKEPSVKESALKNKYDAWVANDWKDGHDAKIKNWKVKLLHTMPFIEKETTKKVAPVGYYYNKEGVLKRIIS